MTKTSSPWVRTAVALALASAVGGAGASGLVFGTQSASNMGVANAGAAAVFDASTIFTNPAGLTRLKGTQVSGALNLVFPDGSFTDSGSTTGTGRPIQGETKAEFSSSVIVPHAYASHELQPGLVAGIGLFVPYGSATEYDDNWTGRYHSTESELKSVNLNPSIAWKANEQWSVGGGISLQYVKGRISKAIDFGSQIGGPAAANPAFDGNVTVTGDDWGFGFNLGVMFEPTPDTRIGAAYRSKIKHKVTGDADFTLPQALASNPAVAARFADTDARLDLTMPESLTVHAFHQIDARWAIMGDITHTRHSRLQELRIKLRGNNDSVVPTDWKDATRYSIGATYKYNEALTLRAGLAYDESPEDDQNRIANIPDNDRTWIAGGASYAFDANRTLDVALAYVKLKDSSIAQQDVASKAVVRGNYDVHSYVLGLQYNQRF
ncbi:OmpP1/FadL family transporter [Caldimonas brevitalea]|uniref:Long-chain fatty acid transport protein n=1 Tax=Caldimonas brevitalea TaxID=413882 RepID=A0A0G3BDH3_9BURK|nr:outer membrane protein transport protein [Caldimonas brevitalea]AKJ27342.1 long-chain fatty acid transport protein [Caldimonas brevitalea]